MIEILSDLTMVWVTLFITVSALAAFTVANVLAIEWELRTNWRKQQTHVQDQSILTISYDPPSMKRYLPKIPSRTDHKSLDDEDPKLVVF
ncbi:hypothetical protein JCM9140_1896 [Halalkalibacter wakoensis JCM 9140]|uniref:Uncharacterized protein n=1 Tax=Halalkalibacter wakoensis JCM 9140 TaxID=1236970 RepID=W4Q1P0_9BACI|nr:hypothetical protein [Halalkalibacter wakoensis]GAE25875.1 hypothetical protein JCM9140_1896 [Halalkalibacter wakoensis JCM 9140]